MTLRRCTTLAIVMTYQLYDTNDMSLVRHSYTGHSPVRTGVTVACVRARVPGGERAGLSGQPRAGWRVYATVHRCATGVLTD
jgi:hypothetical protein